jgi:hypothetical protein
MVEEVEELATELPLADFSTSTFRADYQHA